MPRVNPSDEIETVAYAVSFMKAAKCLAEGEEWEDNHSLIVPFYMLIGFSLENALKAVLEFNGSDPGTKWSHSHDLQKLRLLAEHHDFVLSDDLREFVDHLSPLHKDHHFRYPQKAEAAHLLKPIAATELTESYLWKRSWPSTARNAWTTKGPEIPSHRVGCSAANCDLSRYRRPTSAAFAAGPLAIGGRSWTEQYSTAVASASAWCWVRQFSTLEARSSMTSKVPTSTNSLVNWSVTSL